MNTCGDCGQKIWYDDTQERWQNQDWQTWCKGPDGTRLIWIQQHAPSGNFPVRSQSPLGEVCRCIAMNREHIHRLEIIPDGEELQPN